MSASERRYTAYEVRGDQAPTQGKKILHGLAARFHALSEDLGGFRERLSPGCFRDSLASGRDVAMLVDHDSSKVLGRTGNKTLALREIVEGLAFRCELNDAVSHARDIHEMCLRGDINECSFGFSCDDDSWSDEPDPDTRRPIPVRTVRRARLFEVSAVTFPAYPKTNVTAALADGPIALMAAVAGRSLWPDGSIPAEIRTRFPSLSADDELVARARRFLTRLALSE